MGIYSMNEGFTMPSMTTEYVDLRENYLESALGLVYESELNYNNIMKAVGIHELYVAESTGSEMVYEGADIKGFFSKVKEWIKAAFDKVKELFLRFTSAISSFFSGDAKFVKAYGDKLEEAEFGSSVTLDMPVYTYSNTLSAGALSAAKRNVTSKLSKEIPVIFNNVKASNAGTYNDNMEDSSYDYAAKIRSAFLGGNDKLTHPEFVKGCAKFFLSGDSEKKSKNTITKDEVKECLTKIKNSKAIQTGAVACYKKFVVEIKADEKLAKNAESQAKYIAEDADLAKAYANAFRCLKEVQGCMLVFFGAQLQAIKEENRTAKAIVVRALQKAKEKEAKNESFSYEGYDFLSNVKMI